jgi:hypothetical protein|tara:strand:+ start:4641 stop:4832 length:192 start_codon:yes stop_codon:yes gene_type:complete
MKVSFYIQPDDALVLCKYIESFDEEEENPVLYISNQPTPNDLLVTIDFYEYNELVDLEVLEWL